MKFRKDGGLDMRFTGAKERQAALIMLGVVGAIIVAIFYFIYKYLFIIFPLVIIVLQFKYFNKIKTKFRIYSALSSLLVYIISLAALVFINLTEPVSIYGSYYNDDVNLEIFKNKIFKQKHEDQISDKKYDNDLSPFQRTKVSKSTNLIEFANNNSDLPILRFTKKDKSDYKEYSYYGILHKKNPETYETTLEKIYDKYNKYYFFTDGNPKHDLKFFIKEYTWVASFKGLNFELGSIIAIRFILLSGLIAIIAACLCYNHFKKSGDITKEEDEKKVEDIEEM